MSKEPEVLSVDEGRRVLAESAVGGSSERVVIARGVWVKRVSLDNGRDTREMVGYTVRELSPKPVTDSFVDHALRKLNLRGRDYANLPETQEEQTIRLIKSLQGRKGGF